MLLAIDIGNTFTKYGVFNEKNLLSRFTKLTVRTDTAEDIHLHIAFNQPLQAIIISSVVPELHDSYWKFAERYFNLKPIFVDNSFDFNLKINYQPAENLGIDRLIDAFAAVEKYGVHCIVCDFGTATTIDAIDSERVFLGGIIAPGMKTLAESLFLKTSKLPQVEIEKPEKVIGISTVKAIQSGIFFGYIGLVDGILKRMTEEIGGEKPKIIATGGFAELITENCNLIETVNQDLMLEGLQLLYVRMNK